MLCDACSTIFKGCDEPWYYIKDRAGVTPAYHHHSSPAQLHLAAQEGCHICVIIWRKLTKDERGVLKNTWTNYYLHRLSQAFQRVWSVPVDHYSWSPVWWAKDDFGVRFQFGDHPFWKKIVFRLLPVDEDYVTTHDIENTKPDELVNHTGAGAEPVASRESTQDQEYLVSLWSPKVRHLVERWHTECTTGHIHCRMGSGHHMESQPSNESFQPTRILDLSNNRIVLDVNPAGRLNQRYASLTHRWSLNPQTMPRLSADNYSSFCQNIDPAILTATFHDAVDVARKLQIRYLWIDSLCIQQTGTGWEEDWARESALMGEIYRQAYINIQAGRDANESGMGLFKAPSGREVDPFKTSIERTFPDPRARVGREGQTIEVRGSYSIIEEDFARDELLGNPINQRGWVLQERLLSHRIVHFGAHQVFWECRQLLACETFPNGLPRTIPKTMARAASQIVKTPTLDHSFAKAIKRRLTAKEGASLPVIKFPSLTCHRDMFAWFYLAELYSACSLTRDTDKLVAISGLAQIFGSPAVADRAKDVVSHLSSLALPRSGGAVTDFANATRQIYIGHRSKGSYLAGLWKNELIPCMLWHVANGRQANGSPTRRVQGVCSPTWSWASINGLLHASIYQNWTTVDGMLLCEVAYAETHPVFTQHSWGQVSHGRIILSARVIPQKDLVWEDPDPDDTRVSAHISEVHAKIIRKIKMNSASVARLRVFRADILCYIDDMEEFDEVLDKSGYANEVALLPLIGLQRRRQSWSSESGYIDEVYEYHGLVVAWKPRTTTCTRLGYFRVRDTDVVGHVLDRYKAQEVTIE